MEGTSQTVNGQIRVDDDAQVGDLSTVNGRIEIAKNVVVDGDLQSVNGNAEAGDGSEIKGDVTTVNGDIRLDGTSVTGRVETYNGDVTLRDSTVQRDLVVEHNRGTISKSPIEIRILDGSVIEGDIDVKSKRKVVVYLDDKDAVRGTIRNAEVVFRGEEEAMEESAEQGAEEESS